MARNETLDYCAKAIRKTRPQLPWYNVPVEPRK